MCGREREGTQFRPGCHSESLTAARPKPEVKRHGKAFQKNCHVAKRRMWSHICGMIPMAHSAQLKVELNCDLVFNPAVLVLLVARKLYTVQHTCTFAASALALCRLQHNCFWHMFGPVLSRPIPNYIVRHEIFQSTTDKQVNWLVTSDPFQSHLPTHNEDVVFAYRWVTVRKHGVFNTRAKEWMTEKRARMRTRRATEQCFSRKS